MNNDGKHARKIEDGIPLFPAIKKLIVGLHTQHSSKSKANVMVVLTF